MVKAHTQIDTVRFKGLWPSIVYKNVTYRTESDLVAASPANIVCFVYDITARATEIAGLTLLKSLTAPTSCVGLQKTGIQALNDSNFTVCIILTDYILIKNRYLEIRITAC